MDALTNDHKLAVLRQACCPHGSGGQKPESCPHQGRICSWGSGQPAPRHTWPVPAASASATHGLLVSVPNPPLFLLIRTPIAFAAYPKSGIISSQNPKLNYVCHVNPPPCPLSPSPSLSLGCFYTPFSAYSGRAGWHLEATRDGESQQGGSPRTCSPSSLTGTPQNIPDTPRLEAPPHARMATSKARWYHSPQAMRL